MSDHEEKRFREWGRSQGVNPSIWPGPDKWGADALMAFAYGLEDAAYELKGRSNRKHVEEEEAAWGRMLAL